jgi:hypothetical protein
MSSSLFSDLPLSAAQLNSDYRLSKLNSAGLQLDAVVPQVDAIQGADANNNILIGDAITNVPDVANMVIIGDGNKSNAKAKDILLGDGVTVAGPDVAGSLHVGEGMAAAVVDAARASTHYIPIYYNGTFYRLLVSDTAPA